MYCTSVGCDCCSTSTISSLITFGTQTCLQTTGAPGTCFSPPFIGACTAAPLLGAWVGPIGGAFSTRVSQWPRSTVTFRVLLTGTQKQTVFDITFGTAVLTVRVMVCVTGC